MESVDSMIEAARHGFLPVDGGGHEVNGVLKALPDLFASFESGLSGLAAWMEESGLGAEVAEIVTRAVKHAGAAAETAQAASDRFRADSEFWLSAEGEDDGIPQALASEVEAGFIPGGPDPAGYVLADFLAGLPELADEISVQLGCLSEQMRDSRLSGAAADLVAETASHMSALASEAEEASSTYQDQHEFWLSERE